jgi:hypothetical protein
VPLLLRALLRLPEWPGLDVRPGVQRVAGMLVNGTPGGNAAQAGAGRREWTTSAAVAVVGEGNSMPACLEVSELMLFSIDFAHKGSLKQKNWSNASRQPGRAGGQF